MNHIYLDNNATTRLHPDVAQAMSECFAAGFVNPASQHQLGQQARAVLDDAREGIARLLGAVTSSTHADQIVFTSGGTEANNLVLHGLARERSGPVIVSTIEHPSITATADQLARSGQEVIRIPADENGVVNFDVLRQRLEAGPVRLVSVMLANNETGVIQPLRELAQLCQTHGVPLHTDAVQAVGKLPVSFRDLGVAAMTIAAHKFHGPVGIGALLLQHGVKLEPLLHGGFQQFGMRPGTESVALAVGMFRALQTSLTNLLERMRGVAELRDRLETTLLANLPQIKINGAAATRLPNTSNVSFVGLDRQTLLLALDFAGVACSTGSACASGSSEPSPVLQAMGVSDERISSAIRFSLSSLTTALEVDEASRRIIQVCQNLQPRAGARKSPASARQSAAERL